MKPYFEQDGVVLWHGDCREILPSVGQADLFFTDPPYGETALGWDVWPEGWPALAAACSKQLWCFGSMRMFLEKFAEFKNWKLAQDVVWEKHNGSGLANDRFRRVHEFVLHFYQGKWGELCKNGPKEFVPGRTRRGRILRNNKPAHFGGIGQASYVYGDTRMARSVLKVKSCHGRALHPTEKPQGILKSVIDYSTRPGDLVVDCFAGSGALLLAARSLGRRAVGIEGDEEMCEVAAQRLSQGEMFSHERTQRILTADNADNTDGEKL